MIRAHQTILIATYLAAVPLFSGCDRHSLPAPPAGAATSAAPVSTCTPPAEARQESATTKAERLPAWEPVDAKFAGCAHTCGARAGVNRADAHVQPGADIGDLAYCPVSGAVFRVNGASSRRDVNGKLVYFCCESCANYFSAHADEVLAQRGLSPPGG